MTPDETGGPSLLRLVAKAALQSYVADHAPNVAHGLRRSATTILPDLSVVESARWPTRPMTSLRIPHPSST